MEINEKYLTKKEVKEYTTLSYTILNRGIKSGKLKSVFKGNRHLFKKEWVDKWLEVPMKKIIL
jgi:excisionase family DNA binding protein